MMNKGYHGMNAAPFPNAMPQGGTCGGMPTQVSPAAMGPGSFPTQVSPAGMGPGGFPTQVSPAGMGPGFGGWGGSQMNPPNIAPTQVMPAQVSPTNNVVNKNIIKHVVPHVHPTHTTTVNEHIYQHQHYFPQTQSVVNTCCNQQVICGGMPPMPTNCCPPPRPFCC